jgi:hypothetical protein
MSSHCVDYTCPVCGHTYCRRCHPIAALLAKIYTKPLKNKTTMSKITDSAAKRKLRKNEDRKTRTYYGHVSQTFVA